MLASVRLLKPKDMLIDFPQMTLSIDLPPWDLEAMQAQCGDDPCSIIKFGADRTQFAALRTPPDCCRMDTVSRCEDSLTLDSLASSANARLRVQLQQHRLLGFFPRSPPPSERKTMQIEMVCLQLSITRRINSSRQTKCSRLVDHAIVFSPPAITFLSSISNGGYQ
jgi:hypothetical protein